MFRVRSRSSLGSARWPKRRNRNQCRRSSLGCRCSSTSPLTCLRRKWFWTNRSRTGPTATASFRSSQTVIQLYTECYFKLVWIFVCFSLFLLLPYFGVLIIEWIDFIVLNAQQSNCTHTHRLRFWTVLKVVGTLLGW